MFSHTPPLYKAKKQRESHFKSSVPSHFQIQLVQMCRVHSCTTCSRRTTIADIEEGRNQLLKHGCVFSLLLNGIKFMDFAPGMKAADIS